MSARGLAMLSFAASGLALHLYARVETPGELLGFALFVPWLAVLDRATSARASLVSGAWMSAVFALSVFAWFGTAMAGYADAPAWLGIALLLLFAPLLQPQLLVFAWVRHLAGSPQACGFAAVRRALAGACAYVAAEWLLPRLFGDTLGHGLHPSLWLRQGADLAGPPGLTLALLLANEAVLRALRDWRRAARPAATALAIAGTLAGYGALRLADLRARAEPRVLLRAGLVQADLSRYARLRDQLGSYDAAVRILAEHFELSERALARGPLDLIVWPETVYPTTFGAPKSEDGAELDRAIAGFAALHRVPLVFGAYDVEKGAEYNAAFFLAPGGEYDVYRKQALFPLTERVPAWLDSPGLRRLLPWLGTWRSGGGPRVLELALAGGRALRAGTLICYDAVDPGLARASAREGAELLLALSNDSWFDEGSGPRLHLVVSAFRSVETRLPQIRVTNTGISAAIDAEGTLLGALDVHERDALVVDVPAGPGASTLAKRWGDWLGPVSLCVAALLLLARRLEARR